MAALQASVSTGLTPSLRNMAPGFVPRSSRLPLSRSATVSGSLNARRNVAVPSVARRNNATPSTNTPSSTLLNEAARDFSQGPDATGQSRALNNEDDIVLLNEVLRTVEPGRPGLIANDGELPIHFSPSLPFQVKKLLICDDYLQLRISAWLKMASLIY